MKKLCILLALMVTLALPALAVEDEPIIVDGITFESLADYVQSDYFRDHGKRCGTVIDTSVEGELPPLPGTPADCGNVTNPDAEYAPDIIWRIPVVVHNIRSNSGTGNLTDATIISQIVVLNEDFQALAGTPGSPGFDGKIEFYLATEDPDGNPTNGIMRYNNDTWYNDGGGYYITLNWDPNRYLNIYTNNPGGGILGYVPWLPHTGAPGSASDRVVIWYRAFGDPGTLPPYNLGRTATHEVGHYLGLYHTFQSGCGVASEPGCYSSGDRICDTNAETTARFGCPTSATSCGTPDPIRNYMDYTDDACMNNFTEQQMRRARCTLTHYRPDLWESGDLTGVDETPGNEALSRLYQNVPNPFNPKTEIRFELSMATSAEMQIVDVTGRVIREYLMGDLAAGSHVVTWDGRDDLGRAMASGVYFYRLKAEGQTPVTKRMSLLK